MTARQKSDFIIKPLWMGGITAFLLFADSLIAPLIASEPELNHLPFGPNASFTWMAFVAWTYFFSARGRERFSAVPCIVLGFLAASLIIALGNMLTGVLPFRVVNIPLGGLLGGFLVSAALTVWKAFKIFPLDNPRGIFYGLSLTFSQAIIGWEVGGLKLLGVILSYGILGIFCGYLASLAPGGATLPPEVSK